MKLYEQSNDLSLYYGNNIDVLKTIEADSVDCVVTSPPYWGLRDYGTSEQLGLEPTPEEYVANMVKVFQEIHRVLKPSGTVWLNLGDSYAGSNSDKYSAPNKNTLSAKMGQTYGGIEKSIKAKVPGLKPKDLIGIPWRVAFALQADGWYLRSDIIWQKPNPMPESVKDRPTKSHEYIFLLTKSKKYYYDADAIKEPAVSQDNYKRDRDNPDHKFNNTPGRTEMSGLKDNKYKHRNKRDVWSISTKPYKEAHFAVFPEEIPMNCIKAGSPKDGVVLDPFAGSGTTLKVALGLGRKAIGIDINTEYLDLCIKRCNEIQNILI
mgnify:CR=1 FL=1